MFKSTEEEEMSGRLEQRVFKCDEKDKVCSNILIAVIPALKYDTYDIYVHV